jgi:hypothetical protein
MVDSICLNPAASWLKTGRFSFLEPKGSPATFCVDQTMQSNILLPGLWRAHGFR